MRIALDIETNMAHDVIHLCVTQDIDTGEVKVWKAPTGLWDYLKDATLIAAHNGISFDFPILNKLWKTKIGLKQAYDTLIVSRLLEPTRDGGHSLDAWGKSLGVAKVDYKATWQWMMNRRENYDGECFDNPIDSLLEYYCKRDVTVLSALYRQLSQALLSLEFSNDSVQLEHSVAAIISKQEKNGFKLDTIHATCLLAELKGKMSAINDRMQELYPPYEVERISEKTGKTLKPELVVFNPASRQQIAEKLIGLGWKPTKRTPAAQKYFDEWKAAGHHLGAYDHSKGDTWQVDETILQGLKYPIAQLIAEYMMLQKRIGQIESWLEVVGADGRVHGRVITNGAVTGRMTHMKPNMAQIPNSGSPYGPECRQCWTVEEGNVLVGCDASGLELRMLAHYMKDDAYVKTVCEGSSKVGTDVHTVNQKAAGLQTRDQAKTFIYAFLYGAGPAKIGSIVGGSSTAGQRLINSFLKGTPALQRLRDKVSVYASKGYVPGLDGRKIWVRSEHAALNSLLQGAGAIVMKKALVIFNDKIKANGWDVKLVANVHDEIQFECSPNIAEEAGKACVQSIREAGLAYNLRCPLDGEYKVGRNWRETH
jgi:DNA polymerase I-like protein with 3'-5' exonuclease and polymerase domains